MDVFIPEWVAQLVALVVTVALIPWASWVSVKLVQIDVRVSDIGTVRAKVDLHATEIATLETKVDSLSERIKKLET